MACSRVFEQLFTTAFDASLSTLKSTVTARLIAFAKKQINKYLKIQ